GFDPFCVLRFNLLLTIKQRLNRSLTFFCCVRIKSPFNSTKNDVQRNSRLLPRLHQRPVNRAQKQMLLATSNKSVFNFGEVVEIIHRDVLCAVFSETHFLQRSAFLQNRAKIKRPFRGYSWLFVDGSLFWSGWYDPRINTNRLELHLTQYCQVLK